MTQDLYPCQLPTCKEYVHGRKRKYCIAHMYANGCLKPYAMRLLGKDRPKQKKRIDRYIETHPFQCFEMLTNPDKSTYQCPNRFKTEEWRNVHMIKEHCRYVTGCSRMNPELEARKDFTKLYIQKVNSMIKQKQHLERKSLNKIKHLEIQLSNIFDNDERNITASDIHYQKQLVEKYQNVVKNLLPRLRLLCNHAVEIGGYSMDDIAKKYKIVFDPKYYNTVIQSRHICFSILGEEIASRVLPTIDEMKKIQKMQISGVIV